MHDNLSALPLHETSPTPQQNIASPASRSPKAPITMELSMGTNVTTSLTPFTMRRCTSDPSGQHRRRRRRSNNDGSNDLQSVPSPWPRPFQSTPITAHGIADTARENHQEATEGAAITAAAPLEA
ncbi:unnamed protein product, partial [Sphacelaria rigidula]